MSDDKLPPSPAPAPSPSPAPSAAPAPAPAPPPPRAPGPAPAPPQYPQPHYPQPQYGAVTPPPVGYPAGYPGAYPGMRVVGATNGFAIAALVLGLLGFVACGITAVLALVFGYKARKQIDASGGMQAGRGMAKAGIVLGWTWIGLLIAYFAIIIVFAVTSSPN